MNDINRMLEERRQVARQGGGEKRIEAQHARGKLTARERIDLLLDPAVLKRSTCSSSMTATSSAWKNAKYPVTALLRAGARSTGVPSMFMRKISPCLAGRCRAHSRKINKVQDMALRNGTPIIGILDAGGARIQEGVDALGGYAEVFQRNTLASGVIPQITMIMGPCAGAMYIRRPLPISFS